MIFGDGGPVTAVGLLRPFDFRLLSLPPPHSVAARGRRCRHHHYNVCHFEIIREKNSNNNKKYTLDTAPSNKHITIYIARKYGIYAACFNNELDKKNERKETLRLSVGTRARFEVGIWYSVTCK